MPTVLSLAPPLTGVQRAAVLLVTLGVETAGQFFPALTDDEVERITVEVARLRDVPGPVVEDVLLQYRDAIHTTTTASTTGGLDTARTLLRETLPEDRLTAILPRVEAATAGTGFDLLATVPTEDLAAFLTEEHPQTAAVVLARLTARTAADVLGALPPAVRADVVRRLSLLGPTSPEALADLDTALRERFGRRSSTVPGGVKRAADILTQAGRQTGRDVLDALQADAPDLAGQIEGLLFTFDDLIKLPARSLAHVLTQVDQSKLVVALRGCDEALTARVFESVSERVGVALREEMELSGPVRVSDVEDAQRAVVETVLALADRGEIALAEETAILV